MRYTNVEAVGVRVHLTFEHDGVVGVIALPEEIVSIRAGEYGYDPVDDYDEVIDIVLTELHGDGMAPGADSFLLSADTLEDARELKTQECRGIQARLGVQPSDRTHVKTLASLKSLLVVDQQVALLHRERTKSMVKQIKETRQKDQKTSRLARIKRDLVDELRRRENI